MDMPQMPPSLVERKKYDEKEAHQIARNIWWVGYIDSRIDCSHNPFLLLDEEEAVLINPGSRADEHFRVVRKKVEGLIDTARIHHIVILHHEPDSCASLPLFEKIADRNVKIYAPSQAVRALAYYGCKNPVIGLDEGDSIILRSGRSFEYFETPGVPAAGLGMLHDSKTSTLFSGNLFGTINDEWNLFASADGWRTLIPFKAKESGSRKAHLKALNKIERLSPERICPQCGPIIDDEIEKYISSARETDPGE